MCGHHLEPHLEVCLFLTQLFYFRMQCSDFVQQRLPGWVIWPPGYSTHGDRRIIAELRSFLGGDLHEQCILLHYFPSLCNCPILGMGVMLESAGTSTHLQANPLLLSSIRLLQIALELEKRHEDVQRRVLIGRRSSFDNLIPSRSHMFTHLLTSS